MSLNSSVVKAFQSPLVRFWTGFYPLWLVPLKVSFRSSVNTMPDNIGYL